MRTIFCTYEISPCSDNSYSGTPWNTSVSEKHFLHRHLYPKTVRSMNVRNVRNYLQIDVVLESEGHHKFFWRCSQPLKNNCIILPLFVLWNSVFTKDLNVCTSFVVTLFLYAIFVLKNLVLNLNLCDKDVIECDVFRTMYGLLPVVQIISNGPAKQGHICFSKIYGRKHVVTEMLFQGKPQATWKVQNNSRVKYEYNVSYVSYWLI
jgi:hypothetical protein